MESIHIELSSTKPKLQQNNISQITDMSDVQIMSHAWLINRRTSTDHKSHVIDTRHQVHHELHCTVLPFYINCVCIACAETISAAIRRTSTTDTIAFSIYVSLLVDPGICFAPGQ